MGFTGTRVKTFTDDVSLTNDHGTHGWVRPGAPFPPARKVQGALHEIFRIVGHERYPAWMYELKGTRKADTRSRPE
jgi:hypothetical protein